MIHRVTPVGSALEVREQVSSPALKAPGRHRVPLRAPLREDASATRGASIAGIDIYGVVSAASDGATDPYVAKLPSDASGSFTPLSSNMVSALFGGYVIDGLYYGAYQRNIPGQGLKPYLDVWDMTTWDNVSSSILPGYQFLNNAASAVDPTSEKIYGNFRGSNAAGFYFAQTDIVHLTQTVICTLTAQWNACAFDQQGQLWAITTSPSALYKVDKATGAMTEVGPTGVTPAMVGSMVVDPASGRMFWTVAKGPNIPNVGVRYPDFGALYEVDPLTGTATELFQFPNCEQVVGLWIPQPVVPGKPGEAEGLTATFTDGSLTGHVAFTAPALTREGEAGTGDLGYTLLANDQQVASGPVAWGEAVDVEVTLAQAGPTNFEVYMTNAVGNGRRTSTSLFVGNGVPQAPQAAAALQGEHIVITWSPVTATADGGYIDPQGVTYRVTRLTDDVVVADNLAETTYADTPQAPENGLVQCQYKVQAMFAGNVSGEGLTNKVVLGHMGIPFNQTFLTQEEFDNCTVINANGDDKTWTWYSYRKEAQCKYHKTNTMDDWIVMPALQLKGGVKYRVTIVAKNSSAKYPERLEIMWGDAPTAEAMTNTVLGPTEIATAQYDPYHGLFSPEADGIYYVGIHGISDPDCNTLSLQSVEIKNAAVPAQVTNLKAVPGADGAHTATVSFTAPDKSIYGETLEQIDRITILRNDSTEAHVFENPGVGAELSFVDALDEEGLVSYTVIAANDNGESPLAATECYVGIAAPAEPYNIKITEADHSGKITLTWDIPTTDIYGTALNPQFLTYDVQVDDGVRQGVIAEGLTEPTFTEQAVPQGEQRFVQYLVWARTRGGHSFKWGPMEAVGTPYPLPYIESFANGGLSSLMAYDNPVPTNYWTISQDVNGASSSDGDNGFLIHYGKNAGDGADLWTGWISLKDTFSPTFSFYVYVQDPEPKDENTITVSVDAGSGFEEVMTVVAGDCGEPGWNRVLVPLDDYAGQAVAVKLRAVTQVYRSTLVDQLSVYDMYDKNITLHKVSAPGGMLPNTPFAIEASLLNSGKEEMADVTVTLSRDGEPMDTCQFATIASGHGVTARFEEAYTIFDVGGHDYKIDVKAPGDVDQTDNHAAFSTECLKPVYPAPTALAGERTDAGVALRWTEPDGTLGVPDSKFEGFESAPSWATELPGWTFRDEDASPIGGFQGLTQDQFPIELNSLQSFWVHDASDASVWPAAFAGANGSQKYLASMYRMDQGVCDDWAVTPELSGNAQTVQLMLRSLDASYPESIEILTSATGTEPEDFRSFGYLTPVPAQWGVINIPVARGVKYLAIESVGMNNYMLMLDNFVYEALDKTGDIKPAGYNVYCNGQRLNATPVQATDYLNQTSKGGEYQVTALYAGGESVPSDKLYVEESGLDGSLGADAPEIAVRGHEIVVTNLRGEALDVYGADGRLIYQTAGRDAATIPAAAGVYLVKTVLSATKVVVR